MGVSADEARATSRHRRTEIRREACKVFAFLETFLSKKEGSPIYTNEKAKSLTKHLSERNPPMNKNPRFTYTVINHMKIKGEILMTIEPRPLTSLAVGESGIICAVGHAGGLERRLFDIGCIVGNEIKKLSRAPFGCLDAYEIMGTVIAIREKDAKSILIHASSGGETP